MKKTLQISILALLFLTYLMIGLSYAAGTCNSSSCSEGGTTPWTADSASYADVNYCVNTCAARGEVVNVPAGSASWNTQLTITKSLSLVGAGIGSTVITSTQAENGICVSSSSADNCRYMIRYNPSSIASDAATLFRVSGFTLDADYKVGQIGIYNNSETPHTMVRIDNNNMIDGNYTVGTSGSDTRATVLIRGPVYGVMDNNTLSGVPIIRIYGNSNGKWMWNNLPWVAGSGNTFFVEDNSITFNYASHTDWSRTLDGTGWGSSWVVRYNDYTASPATSALIMIWDSHPSVDDYGTHATRGKEAYGNDLTGMGRFFPRCNGGQSLVFFNRDNDTSSTYVPCLVTQMDYANEPGLTTCGSNAVASEVGRTTCAVVDGYTMPQHPHREYEWANWWGSTPTKWNGYSSSGAIALRNNLDYFNYTSSFNGTSGVGCGTLANRPATCTTGVGYWATDQNCGSIANYVGVDPTTAIAGTFYRCNTANNWTKYYTPYTYPHPLRGGADTTAPVMTFTSPLIEVQCEDESAPYTQTLSLTLTTDEPATCKYTIGTDEVYADLDETFTGTGTTSHTATTAAQTCGASYTIYYACQDDEGTPNVATTASKAVTIGDAGDSTAPVITSTTQAHQSCTANSLLMTITTDEASTCKWSETDEAYADMDYFFSVTGGETVHHSVNITGQACEDTVTRYVRCSDTQSNVNASSTAIDITTDAAKSITISIGGAQSITIGTGTNTISIVP